MLVVHNHILPRTQIFGQQSSNRYQQYRFFRFRSRSKSQSLNAASTAQLLGEQEDAEILQIKQQSDKEYGELRKSIIRNTQRAGGILTVYVYLVFNAKTAFCCMAGSIASYLYVLLLVNDVDSLKKEDISTWLEINKMRQSPQKTLMKAVSSYSISLKPRLLVPIALAMGIWAYNQNAEEPLSIVNEAAVLAGFLAYKGSLILRLWTELKPKVEEIKVPKPTLRDVEEDKYDYYGNLRQDED
eukprot:TRINITY_DN3889_c0_g1_i1.p2 TRINITY_DN3889_c0_g1~~TRINITY_DN3889_c0_g1_i1.p2  ORF type:complete len:242 (+),score=27.62 TRINITY_DN3889_c0_g1_i1:65-790(+)